MIKLNDLPKNVNELHILGVYEDQKKKDLKLLLEEICQSTPMATEYNIISFYLEAKGELQNITNLVELHHNLKGQYKTGEFNLRNEIFYNEVDYMEKLDQFLIISKFFVKYINNTYIHFPLGSCRLIEMSRCEANMNEILLSIGYREKDKIKKSCEILKCKNSSIIICLSKIYIDLTETEANKKIDNLIEIFGLCYDSDKESMQKELAEIREKLSLYCVFEGNS
jgi:hypothetical protein